MDKTQKPVSTKIVSLVVAILLWGAETVQGGCRQLYVSGARYNPGLNGYYYRDGICGGGYTVWQKYYDSIYVNFYFTQSYYSESWIISTYRCPSYDDGIVRNLNSKGYSEPQKVPGTWDEWNYSQLQFQGNPSFYVQCTEDDLSGWEIFGIVIGCICGVLLIIAAVVAICKCSKKKKQQRAAACADPLNTCTTQTTPYAAYNSGEAVTITTISASTQSPYPPPNQYYPAPPYPSATAYPAPPPVYDNSAYNSYNQAYK